MISFFVFGLLCFLIVVSGLSVVLAIAVFAPLHKIGELQRAPWQFRLCDFLVLLAVLQVVAGLSIAFLDLETPREKTAVITFLTIVVSLWWLGGVRLLSKGRVEELGARVLFLGVAVPLTCVLSFVVMAAPAIILFQAAGVIQMLVTGDGTGGIVFLAMTGVEVTTFLALWFCRKMAALVAAQSRLLNHPSIQFVDQDDVGH